MLEAYGASDPGCVRSNNEDYFLVVPAIGLYLVADGMGGAQAGEHASRLAAETIQQAVQQNGKTMDADGLVVAFGRANQRVMDEAARDPQMEGMGTTLVAAVENDGDLVIASVGDSRVYTFENGTLQAITEDQTWVNEVGRRLGIDEENLKNHPMRHVLTMAIGVSDNLRVHTHRIHPVAGHADSAVQRRPAWRGQRRGDEAGALFPGVARGKEQGADRAWPARAAGRTISPRYSCGRLSSIKPCPFLQATNSARTKSLRRLARAAWEKCTEGRDPRLESRSSPSSG